MENRYSEKDGDLALDAAAAAPASLRPGVRILADEDEPRPVAARHDLPDSEQERAARQRLFDEVLAGVELVLVADGAAFWREEPDHSLVLTASRSVPPAVLDSLDRNVTTQLQSIMQRWPESPLVAVPINDPANPIAEEIRQVTDEEGIVGLAGVPCRTAGEMLGLLIVIHRKPHPWTVRDLGLATGFAGQLATAILNAGLYASVRSLAARLTAIHELSLRLNQIRDADAIDLAIVSEVGRLVDCDTVRVYRQDAGEQVFRPVAAFGKFVGIETPPLEALSLGNPETLPGWVAKRNEALIIADASVERRSIFRSSFGPESVLLVPMSYGDAVQGVLVVSKEGADRYGPEDQQALSIFGRYAAQAIVNANNIEQLERQQAFLEKQVAAERRLLDLSEQLVSTLDPRRVLEQIADTIGSVVHFDRLTIYRLDRETDGIQAVIARTSNGRTGEAPPEPDAISGGQSVDEGLTSWVIGRGDAVCANDLGEEALTGGLETAAAFQGVLGSPRPEARATRHVIVVPLRVHGEVVGSLNLTRVGGPETRFTEHEFDLGKLFAGQASIALQNAETHVTVSTRADLDALTGLRNHGTFQRDLASLIEAGEPFSLLMMDLDSFKAFNDTYGHPAGDALLQTVSRAVLSAIRQNDQAYRYGGDEFAILLRGAFSKHASDVVPRVRWAVRDGVQSSAVGGFGVRVGASIGAAHWPADGAAAPELVKAADAALYRDKRNRSEREDQEIPAVEARRTDVPPSLLDAARDLIGAVSIEAVASILVRHVGILYATEDAFVDILDELPEPVAPVQVAPGSTADMAGSPEVLPEAVRSKAMIQVAGSGRFATRPHTTKRGAAGGLWGRVWQSGTGDEEERAETRSVAIPIKLGDQVVGMLGAVARSSAPLARDRQQASALLADLAAAALRRVMRSVSQGD